MKVPCGLLLALCALCFAGEPLGAQSPEDSLAVRVAAIRHVQQGSLRRDTVVLDPEDVDLRDPDGRSHGVGMTARSVRDRGRSESANRALVEATGLSLGSPSEVVSCPGPPRAVGCMIAGGSALVSLSAPTFDGDSATITVKALQTGGRGGTLHVEVILLTLRQRQGAWVVDRARTIFIT